MFLPDYQVGILIDLLYDLWIMSVLFADECLLDCPQGYAQDLHGNKLCRCDEPRCAPLNCRRTCPHGYRTNKLGCEVCKCDSCKPLDKCTKRCAHGLVLNAKNCVICKCIREFTHAFLDIII